MTQALPATTQRFLTGITTTGTPHLGNFVGSIRPSVAASLGENAESFYFLADYHALIKCGDPARIQQSTLEIAASWLAAGLDPERVVFYRQSDVPEITELTWLLTCVTGKGMLNRAHAYKASVDKNTAAGNDAETDITAGLFMYPVLMAADILMFKAHKVPVGRDQVQHIEMARDIAQRFNHLYGEHLTLPEAMIEESVSTLPGLDGRKMSKSYDNTIPVFSTQAELKKLIAAIVTDSLAPGQAKQTEGSALFQIYQAFASPAETELLRQSYASGMGWGDIKALVFERLDREITPMREQYLKLMRQPEKIEAILLAGAIKARAIAVPLLSELRHAVGLRKLEQLVPVDTKPKNVKTSNFGFKQYRESDGQFYFKLVSKTGKLLLQSHGFASPREAAQVIARIQAEGSAVLDEIKDKLHLLENVEFNEISSEIN